MLDFRILGPFEVLDGDRQVVLGGPKQRALLVILLLGRGEVLSRDRLIDELWGERPPASAAKTVQVYVSNLRKALGDGVLLTLGQGYLLQVAPGQTDADRVVALVSEGRAALEGGDPQRASDRLEEALAQWPSQPLADFAYEPFAQEEIARLEEERFAALEARIDADLALGRHAALIGELEMLAGQHSLRERLQAQLMLALYRSGRQTEALARYQQARSRLIDELGIEPGPELQDLQRAILTQDRALAGPRRRAPSAASSRRVGRLVAFAGVLLIAAAAAATLELLGGTQGTAALASASSDSVALISPASTHLRASFPVGGNPSSLAASAGAVWALNADDRTVTRIDLSSHIERPIGTDGIPVDLAAGDGSVWVVNAAAVSAPTAFPGATPTPFPEPTSVSRLDPVSASRLAPIPLPRTVASSPPGSYQIAVGSKDVWVIDADGSVSRIDPASNRVVQTVPNVDVSAIATGAEGTWAVEQNEATGSIAQLTAGRAAVRHVPIPAVQVASSLSSIAVGAGAVWVTDPQSGLLWRIDPGPLPIPQPIRLAPGASDVAYGAGAIWVANGITGTVSRVDPRTNQVTQTIAVGNTPGRLIAGDGGVWVAVAGTNGVSVPAASQSHSALDALPASVCGPVLSGGNGPPQRLIVSDLPLHGGPGVPALQMNAAITLVLREHHFRAGRVPLGYQTCDDSTAQTGVPDARTCASNAHAWVQHPLVIGMIGPYTSGCALSEIPITNQHGLAIISPTNSFDGLTHPDPLATPGELTQLYPTGVRNYARVYPADDREAAALAQFARQHSHASVYVLRDATDSFSQDSVTYFQNAARRIGLHLAGSGTWNQPPRTYPALADRIASSGASAVYLGLDGVDRNAGALIRGLRQRLARRVEILTNWTAIPVNPLFQYAGSAARGVIIATAQVPAGPLDPAGRQFVARFAATQQHAPINPAALYAAQATEVMLDAIAHSNATRLSVARALLATCVQNGILGSFCFDANGDPTVTPVTILQASQPHDNAAELDTSGTKVVAVIDARGP